VRLRTIGRTQSQVSLVTPLVPEPAVGVLSRRYHRNEGRLAVFSALLTPHVSIQICSSLMPVRLGPPLKKTNWPPRRWTKAMVSPGQDTVDWLNILVPAGAGILGYCLLLFANPVVDSFRDGWLVLRRYPAMWIWLVSLSLAYVVFQIVTTWQTGEVSFSPY